VNRETTFNSKARVICDLKHESDKTYITCLETGEWETAECVKLGMIKHFFTCYSSIKKEK
jgi:hypothetical protein